MKAQVSEILPAASDNALGSSNQLQVQSPRSEDPPSKEKKSILVAHFVVYCWAAWPVIVYRFWTAFS